MNKAQTSAYLSMTDEDLLVLGLNGISNNREVATAYVGGSDLEESLDGIVWEATDDPAWDAELKYQIKISYKTTVATQFVAPLEKVPAVGTVYYSPCLTDERKYLIYIYTGSEGDGVRLARGLMHSTKEAALTHSEALLSVVVA